MKRILITLTLFFSMLAVAFAQAPQKFTYQAVVRNESNTLVRGNVGVRITILQGGANGTMVYQETHTAVTNANGLMTLQVGGGTVLSGDFAAIDWAAGPYFLKTETDPTGGTNYTIEGTQQLLSVPYALYAGHAANSFSGSYNDLTDQPDIPQIPENVSAFNNDAGYITMDSIPEIPTVPTIVSAFTNDAGYITMDSIPEIPTVPTNVSAFVNDAGYVTESTLTTENYITQNDLITNNYVTEADIPTNVSAFTNDAGYITLAQVPSQVNADWNATSGVAQIMNKPTIPNIPTTVSSFQNDMNYVTQSVMNVTLANYAPLSAIPTIPTNVSYFYNDANYITAAQVPAQVNADWNATSGTAQILNKPTIPTVPTNVSSFQNDAGYLTAATVQQAANIPTQVSAFENDAHYISDVQLQNILNGIYHTIDSLQEVIEDLNLQLNPTLGTVTTGTASEISYTTAVCGGEVVANGGSSILAAGVCYGTTIVPTIADNVTTDSYSLGSFISTLSGLTAGTTYYVRAYVTTEVGTAYGAVVNFTTLASEMPVVTTSAVSDVLASSAVCGGNVLTDGGLPVTARGLCYSSTNPAPTVADNVTTDGTGTGEFITTILGLNSVTTYYVRAYATNALGTAYGEVRSFTTVVPTAPVVTTSPVTDILPHTATFHGEVVSNGGAMLSARGFCYSTSHNPTIEGDHTNDGTTVGVFESTVATLAPTTTYYVRAYATNIVGTVYGEETSFTSSTTPPGVTTNNVTNITQTSASCGGAVTYAGGAAVTAKGLCYSTSENPTIEDNTVAGGTGVGAFTGELTGLVSNTTYHVRAYATNSVGTDYGEERTFTTLPYLVPTVEAVSATNISYYSFTCGGNITDAGTYEVTARGLCYATTPNPTISNSYVALGSGIGSFSTTLSELTPNTTYYVRAYAINSVGIAYSDQMEVTTLANTAPVVVTISADVDGICQGNVTSDGGLEVTERGFCYSRYPNPTVFDSYIVAGFGEGAFEDTLPDLVISATYYVKAYATNSLGTTYGEQLVFEFTRCPSNLTDRDGNTYHTVKIGTQCWMKENLRTTKYANGNPISQGSSNSSTVAYWYYPDNSSSNKTTYGLLYNWKAVMRNSASSSDNPSGVQGICPTGWHVPSDAEWTQLTDYVSSQSQYQCDSSSTNIGKALASTTGWNSSTSTCAVGNSPSQNNSTGFSALPAGSFYGGSYSNFGSYAIFWSTTAPSNVLRFELGYNRANVYRGSSANSTNYGYSVRCVRD